MPKNESAGCVTVATKATRSVVVVSGGFDPLHSGHLKLFRDARQFGNKLCVIVNSDEWLTKKKGRPFMPFEERADIIAQLQDVDNVFGGGDEDGSVCGTLEHIKLSLIHI